MSNITYTWMNDPFFIGWDKMFSRLDNLSKVNAGGFPPYNVVQGEDEDSYLVEMALAGYKQEDIEIIEENGTLTIKGESKERDGNYIHKGIAGRKFTRSFSLAEHMEVQGAELSDGMLYVLVKRNIPEEKKPKKIEINSPKRKSLGK